MLIGFDIGSIDEIFKSKNDIISLLNLVDYGSLSCRMVKEGVFEYRSAIVTDMLDASVWCLLFRHSLSFL